MPWVNAGFGVARPRGTCVALRLGMAQHKQRSRIASFKQPFLLGAAASAALSSACGSEPKTAAPDDVVDGAIVDGTNVSDVDSGAPSTWNSCNPPICPDTAPDVGSPCGGYEEDDCYVGGQHFICDENHGWQLAPDGGASTQTGPATGPTSASSVDVSDAGGSTGGLVEAGATQAREAGASETTILETAPLEAGVAATETATSGTLDAGPDETGTEAGALDAAVSLATSGAVHDGG